MPTKMPDTYPEWVRTCRECVKFWYAYPTQATLIPELAKKWGVPEWDATAGFYEHFHYSADHLRSGYDRERGKPNEYGPVGPKRRGVRHPFSPEDIRHLARSALYKSGGTRRELAARLNIPIGRFSNWIDTGNCPNEKFIKQLQDIARGSNGG